MLGTHLDSSVPFNKAMYSETHDKSATQDCPFDPHGIGEPHKNAMKSYVDLPLSTPQLASTKKRAVLN